MLLCWASPGEICCYLYLWICTVFTLSTKCSRTTLLCCSLPGKMCCCLYLRIRYPIQVLKELLNEYLCVCIIRCILDRKVNRFSQEMFLPKRLFQIFFPIHTTPLFLSCKNKLLCLLKTYQFLVIHEWPSVFRNNLYHCYLIQFFWLFAKSAINFSN